MCPSWYVCSSGLRGHKLFFPQDPDGFRLWGVQSLLRHSLSGAFHSSRAVSSFSSSTLQGCDVRVMAARK